MPASQQTAQTARTGHVEVDGNLATGTAERETATTFKDASARRMAPLETPTSLTADSTRVICGALTILLADMFALYLETKNFHWHVSGPRFRDYQLDDQAEQIVARGCARSGSRRSVRSATSPSGPSGFPLLVHGAPGCIIR